MNACNDEIMSVEEQVARVRSAAERTAEIENPGEPITVISASGDSRLNPGRRVSYMVAAVDGIEIYEERDSAGDEYETVTWDELRFAFCQQAIRRGVNHYRLQF